MSYAQSLLEQLVATASVNPMGRPNADHDLCESQLTNHLEGFFRELGLPYERQPVAPNRENIVARLAGEGPAEIRDRVFLLDAHQDTVPVEGMTIDPFTPTVRDGRLYGRGACDVKGGMAAMLAAVARLCRDRPSPRPTVVMSCTVNEECGFTGAAALQSAWKAGSSTLLLRPPDAIIVAEPTELNVVVAHKGVARWRLETIGQAVHSSHPEQGTNAIYAMARVLGCLEQYANEVVPHLAEHPLLGHPTLCATMIRGGVGVNVVPEQCGIEIDRRVLPEEDPVAVIQHAAEYLIEKLGSDFPVSPPTDLFTADGLSDSVNGPLAARLIEIAGKVDIESQLVGVSFATNASLLAAGGVPCVVFGPGSIDQAHTKEEWIDLAQLDLAAEIYYRFLCEV